MREVILQGRKIQIVPANKTQLLELSEDEDVLGYFDAQEQKLYIYSGLSGEIYNRVLLHELTHVLFTISGMGNLFSEKQQEAVCDLMEAYLDLFQNKKFVDFVNG